MVEAVIICCLSDLEQLVIHERDISSSVISDSSPGSGTCPGKLSSRVVSGHLHHCQVLSYNSRLYIVYNDIIEHIYQLYSDETAVFADLEKRANSQSASPVWCFRNVDVIDSYCN